MTYWHGDLTKDEIFVLMHEVSWIKTIDQVNREIEATEHLYQERLMMGFPDESLGRFKNRKLALEKHKAELENGKSIQTKLG